MPNWAEEMVAPVVGETNLFMQSCCMIRPATLIPDPGTTGSPAGGGRREIRKISSCSSSPDSSPDRFISITPRNSDQIDSTRRASAKSRVERCRLMGGPPLKVVISYN